MKKKRKDNKGRTLWKGEAQYKNGRYCYRYTDTEGKRRSVYSWRLVATDIVPEGKRQTKCLRDIERDIRRGIEDGMRFTNPDMQTLNDFWERYISMKYEIKESTLINYVYTYNRYVRERFGKRPITSIKYSDVKRFYLSLIKQGVHPTTLDNVHTVVHPLFTLAVRDGYIRNNPSDGLIAEIKKSYECDKKKRNALTMSQQNAFVTYVSESFEYRSWLPIITVFLGTGLRVGELIGLRWDDVSFEKNIISVNHSLIYRTSFDGACRFYISTPKTKSGIRAVPMMREVRETLKAMYDRRFDFHPNMELIIDGYTNFIFRNLYGNIQSPSSINKALARIVRDYNIQEKEFAELEKREPLFLPHISCHHLRHTFATRLVECECDIKTVQDTMGHSDVHTTLSIYVDSTNEKKQASFAALDGKFKIK